MKSGEEITTVDSDCKTSVIQYDYINTIDVTSQINSDSVNNGNLCSNNEIECSSRMNDILTEFTKLYTEKLRRIDDVSGEEELKQKVSLLECWVKDLGEQNSVLVSTVEDLEKEANRRVFLLQEKLDNMAIVTRKSCVSLRDHQVQVTSLIKKKLTVEDEAKVLQEKILNLETVKNSLLQENSFLRQDLDNVLEVVSRGRVTGRWECNEITFNSIRPDQIIGSEQEKALRNYSLQILENSENEKTHNDSLTSIQSIEDDVISVPKLKQEIQNLKKVHRDTNAILIQRDKHIADLQAQLTELHHKLSAAQAQVDNTTSTLHCLIDRGRHDSLQIIRRDDVIRQLLSPTRRFKNENLKAIDEDDTKMKTDIECQLNHNIDLLANRLIELEEECQQLKHQNALLNKSQAIEASSVEKMNDFQNNVSTLHDRRFINSAYISVDVTNKQTQTEEKNSTYNNSKLENISSHNMLKVSKLENELSEKNILIRELQNHLVLSREELRLKDETLYNIEQKLESKRRNYDEKEERMLYLTSQLTNLQLEVSRLHGNLQQTRLELDSKSELVLKLEYENRSLVRQLNEKSSVYEGIQNDISHLLLDIENKKKEIADQKRTIGSLQDALVASKINCDKLRSQYVTEDNEWNHSGRRGSNHRCLQKGKLCSCKRAKSFHTSEELKALELRSVVDELRNYLREANHMAQTVEKERDKLESTLAPEHPFHLQETQRQRDTLLRIKNESISLMCKLRKLKDDLSNKHQSCEDLTKEETMFNISQENKENRHSKFLERKLQRFSSPKPNYGIQSEMKLLQSKMATLENELQKEKQEKESLSKDANVVVSSVRQWLHFQKVANSHFEDKFLLQQKEIHKLIKENQILIERLRNFKELHKNNVCKIGASTSRMQDSFCDPQESLTNDTGIEESSLLSNSSSVQEDIAIASGDYSFSHLPRFKNL